MSGDQKRTLIQIVLAIVIVVLSYVLYVSITGPYQEVLAQERATERVRQRMDLTRDALVRHRDLTGRFPGTLDSLAIFARQNSDFGRAVDSLAQTKNMRGFSPDSLLRSPSGQLFEYALNDTAGVDIYRLRDPDSNNQIGSLEPDPTQRNAASWE